jgi:site-specific DNA-methyltransferase (adenine-specific)
VKRRLHLEAAPRGVVLVGDAVTRLAELPGESVDTVVTSPPYFRLRDYQMEGQIGLENKVEDWVAGLMNVVREIRRVLVPTGTLWLNLGDTYSTHPSQGAARKSLLLAPEHLATALVADGWILRNKIVWAKTNPLPTAARDRLATTWEIIYLLTPSASYFFDLDAVRVPHRSRPGRARPSSADVVPDAWRGPNVTNRSHGLRRLKAEGRVGHPLGKNIGDLWPLATAGFRGGHFAAFPRALAERAIRAGCPERRCQRCRQPWLRPLLRQLGGVATRGPVQAGCDCRSSWEPGLVLDPFMGAGTTAVVAESLDRDWLGIELNSAFAALTEERLRRERTAKQRGQSSSAA